jgi:hypothetical protein
MATALAFPETDVIAKSKAVYHYTFLLLSRNLPEIDLIQPDKHKPFAEQMY